jgi:hypothetical protein
LKEADSLKIIYHTLIIAEDGFYYIHEYYPDLPNFNQLRSTPSFIPIDRIKKIELRGGIRWGAVFHALDVNGAIHQLFKDYGLLMSESHTLALLNFLKNNPAFSRVDIEVDI